jgi:hypothetical protein
MHIDTDTPGTYSFEAPYDRNTRAGSRESHYFSNQSSYWDQAWRNSTDRAHQEEMAKAEDLGHYYRVVADNRDANYAAYSPRSETSVKLEDYN